MSTAMLALQRATHNREESGLAGAPAAPAPKPAAAPPPQRRLAWSDSLRGVPNAALRSALFGVVKKGMRQYLERQEIHAQEGVRIVYTGARLDQADLDVWETVLHIAREQELGDECKVTAYRLLKKLGKMDTGANRATLNCRLSRMKATAVDVRVSGFGGYEGSLIDEVYRAEESREYVIRLNPRLGALFAKNQFTLVNWSVRRGLDGKPLAQWLHSFYSTHSKHVFPLKMETLIKLSGASSENPRSARQTLKKALDALAHAQDGFNYDIRDGLVHVVRT